MRKIISFILITFSFFSCSNNDNSRLYSEAINQLEESIMLINFKLQQHVDAINYHTELSSKNNIWIQKFNSTKKYVDELIFAVDSLIENFSIDSKNKRKHSLIDISTIIKRKQNFEAHIKSFLNDEKILIEKRVEVLNAMKQLKIEFENKSKMKLNVESHYRLAKIKFSVLMLQSIISEHYVNSINSSCRWFTPSIPRVIVNSSRIRAGDTFIAELYLQEKFRSEPYEIVVNDKSKKTILPFIYKKVAPNENAKYKLNGYFVEEGPGGKEHKLFMQEWESFKPTALISSYANNFLYIGIGNPISVVVPDVPESDYRVRMINGTLIPTSSKGNYICRVKNSDTIIAKIIVEVKSKNNTYEIIHQNEFLLRELEFQLIFGDLPSGTYSKKRILNELYLVLKPDVNITFDGINIQIKKYKVVFYPRNKDTFDVEIEGNDLTPLHKYIKTASKGDFFIIKDIDLVAPHRLKIWKGVKIVIGN